MVKANAIFMVCSTIGVMEYVSGSSEGLFIGLARGMVLRPVCQNCPFTILLTKATFKHRLMNKKILDLFMRRFRYFCLRPR